jgi:hypothetical protein
MPTRPCSWGLLLVPEIALRRLDGNPTSGVSRSNTRAVMGTAAGFCDGASAGAAGAAAGAGAAAEAGRSSKMGANEPTVCATPSSRTSKSDC